MKIYFATTVMGDRSNLSYSKLIVNILKEMGHKVLTEHLILLAMELLLVSVVTLFEQPPQ